ncbi:uridine kinase [Marinobacterium sp. LSUCC0821]|uniref:uridine kinase family protein n=1 Tax=Marinobacterium sp. LSUCC0821 TaxID=2668067 RepID=UPI00145137D2|nr:AAA family ATPase [Marinobacterium sp. LSUCC0821]QJD70804.1 AAA family ATPase [Marinobacterium sp. LSUCC0821]
MTTLVAIVGASGSGKSTIATHLKELLIDAGLNVSLFSQDAFYNPIGHPLTNYDEPKSLELDYLASILLELKSGRAVKIPTYDFVTHRRQKQTELIEASDFVIVEGLFLISNESLRSAFDKTIYLDVPQSECFERRLRRDQNERGRHPEDIKRQYDEQVLPGFNNYILPFIKEASITIKPQSPSMMAEEIYQNII